MAKLTEIERWEEEIYRIEENDPVHGGENGITNKPTKQLANRTLFLRKQLQLAGQKLVPKKITAASRNEADETGHTHEIERGDTTKAGLMQLTNDTGLESENLGLSAKGGKAIAQSVAQLQQRLNDGLNQKVNKTDISDAVNSESRTTVASSKAVKTAYDKAVEANNKVDAVAVGATNLLLNSNVPYSGSAYYAKYALAEAPAVGEEVVITLWGELGAQRTGIGVYNTHGFSEIARLTKLRDGVYQGKGVWRKPISNNQEQRPNDTHLNVYFFPHTATDNNRINRIQLERGNIGTDWKPNREDIKSDVQKETRTKFITVRGGSQAVTFDAAKRSDWFREMQIPESGGWGCYTQAFHNSGTQHVYSNFPLNGRFHFTAEVFHSAGFSHVRITYPSQNRVFETAVNFNQEDLTLGWREVVLVKDGVHQGDFRVKGSLVSDYRLRVERNDARYPPYIQTVDANIDISRGISANKVIGEYFCYVKDGENDRAKSVHRTGILTDGNVFTELGQWNAENQYQVPWKSFSKTNNTVIGKTTDNERDRLQVNGTIQATAPEAAANNDQVPTTAWVRNYGIAQSGNQVLNGQLNVGRANEWKKLGFPSGNGELVWEAHPQASQATPNSVRFNVKFLENGQDARYVSFPEFGTANETVAYRSWVDAKATALANAKVSKAGDTMTGALKSKHIGVGAYRRQYQTDAPFLVEANSDSVKDSFHPFIKGKMRSLGNYGGSFSFGWTSHQGDGDGFGKGTVVWAGDNAETINEQHRVWSFETNGDFVSAGDVKSANGKNLSQALMLSDVRRRTYSRTVNGDSRDDNGTTRTMNLTGEVIVYPDGKIEQIFHLQHFRDIWFAMEEPAVGMPNMSYWGRLIPIELWTAMPQKVLYVDVQLARSSNSNVSVMYTAEALEHQVGWAIRKQGNNRGKVWIDIGRIKGGDSEHIDLIVKVEGY